ncbi:hypothetical protein BDFB_009956, partial [Asbolus verrucosus]
FDSAYAPFFGLLRSVGPHSRSRREFLELDGDGAMAPPTWRREKADSQVYELRNITVIHCISERPVTTFIQGQQVYTRTRSAQARTRRRSGGRILAGPSRLGPLSTFPDSGNAKLWAHYPPSTSFISAFSLFVFPEF